METAQPTHSDTGSDTAPRVLILGAGARGKEMVGAFSKLGVHVFVADSYGNSAAAQATPKSFAFDLRDAGTLKALVDKVDPTYVVPCSTGINLAVLESFAASSGCVVPSRKSLEFVFDRERTLTMASKELGVPTPRFQKVSSREELTLACEQLGFPVYVGPLSRISLLDATPVASIDDAIAAWAGFGAGEVLVERPVEADFEITLVAARSIDPHTGKLATWYCEPIGYRLSNGELAESWQPCALGAQALENARSLAARVAGAIGGRGVYAVELSVSGDDVYFVGVTPFPHRTGVVTDATQRFNDCDLHARAILGLPLDVTLITPGAAAAIPRTEELKEVSYPAMVAALTHPESDVRVFDPANAKTHAPVGMGLVTAETVDEAREGAAAVARAVIEA